jgi:hypothetical protein
MRNPLTDGARKMNPTKKHRIAMWENMLGTVYARNDAGETKYFDYDWAAAREFAGVDQADRDPRVMRAPRNYGDGGPRKGQYVLYVTLVNR